MTISPSRTVSLPSSHLLPISVDSFPGSSLAHHSPRLLQRQQEMSPSIPLITTPSSEQLQQLVIWFAACRRPHAGCVITVTSVHPATVPSVSPLVQLANVITIFFLCQGCLSMLNSLSGFRETEPLGPDCCCLNYTSLSCRLK